MTVSIDISIPKLKAWQKARLGIAHAAMPDEKSVKATLCALIADAGLGGCVGITVTYAMGRCTAHITGEGDASEAACEAIRVCGAQGAALPRGGESH